MFPIYVKPDIFLSLWFISGTSLYIIIFLYVDYLNMIDHIYIVDFKNWYKSKESILFIDLSS